MRVTPSRSLCAALVLSAVVGFTPRVFAGDDDDQKKKEKEWKKLEEKQKEKGGQKPDEKGPQGEGDAENGGLPDNPLAKILDLMKEVETRLNDSDASEYTQEDQKKIIEAMKFEDKAKTALDDLIKKIEDMQNNQQQQQSGGEQSEQQKKQQQQQGQNKNETPEQKRERERQERERQRREKREEEQRKRSNPQQQKKDPKDQEQQKKDQKKEPAGKKPPEDQRNPLDPHQGDANRWGDLPAKLHSDAEKARATKVPERWRDQIERYREETAKQQ